MPWPVLHRDVSRRFTHEVEVQFRDLDTRAHVNHLAYAAYFERGKERLFEDVLGVSLSEASTVVRSLDVDYLSSLGPDTTVTVALGPIDVGDTSLAIDYELRHEGDVVATGRTVSIYLDGNGQPARIPDDWRKALAPYAPDEDEE